MKTTLHIRVVLLIALSTWFIGCSGEDKGSQASNNSYFSNLLDARTFKPGQTYQAFEPVQFDVQDARGREDVSVRFVDQQGNSVEQRAILVDGVDTYIISVSPAVANANSNWTVEFIVGQTSGTLGSVQIQGLPSLNSNRRPGEITLQILEGFVAALQRDIRQLELSMETNNTDSADAIATLAQSQQLLTSQQQELGRFRSLVTNGTPINNANGELLFDRNSLTIIDRTYLGLLDQFTSANLSSLNKSTTRTVLANDFFDTDYSNFADELVNAYKDSVWEAGRVVGGTIGPAVTVVGMIVAAAGATTVGPAIAVVGATAYVVSTYVPAALTTIVSAASDVIQDRPVSTDALKENVGFIAQQTCRYGVNRGTSLPLGGYVCDAVKKMADLTEDLVNEVEELAENIQDNFTDTNNTPEDNSGCSASFGSTLCERYNYDISFINNRGIECCLESRRAFLDVFNGGATSFDVSSSCSRDINSFVNDFGGQSAFLSNFDIEIPTLDFDPDAYSDPDAAIAALEAELEQIRQSSLDNLPSCQ